MIKYLLFLLLVIDAFTEARPLPCPILNEQVGSIVCCETKSQGPLRSCTEHLPIRSFKSSKVWSQTTIDLANDLLQRAQSKNGLDEIFTTNVGEDFNRRRQIEADAKIIIGDLNFPKKCCCDERKMIVTLSEGYSYEQDVKYKIYQELPLMGQAVMQSTCSSDSCIKRGVRYSCVQVHTFIPQYVVDDKLATYLQKVPIKINKGCICKVEKRGKSTWKKIFIRSVDKTKHKRRADVDNVQTLETTPTNSRNYVSRERTRIQNMLDIFKKVKSKLDAAYYKFVTKLTSLRKADSSPNNVDDFVTNFHDAAALIHIATKLIKVKVSSQKQLPALEESTTLKVSYQKQGDLTTFVPKFPETKILQDKENRSNKLSISVTSTSEPSRPHNLVFDQISESPTTKLFPFETTMKWKSKQTLNSTSTHSSLTFAKLESKPLVNCSSADSHCSPKIENEKDSHFNFSSDQTPLELIADSFPESLTGPSTSESTVNPSTLDAFVPHENYLEINNGTDLTEVELEKKDTKAVNAGQEYTLASPAMDVKISNSDYNKEFTRNYNVSAQIKDSFFEKSLINLSGKNTPNTIPEFEVSQTETLPTQPDKTRVLMGAQDNKNVQTSTPYERVNGKSKMVTNSLDSVSNEQFIDTNSEQLIEGFTTLLSTTKFPSTITSRKWQKVKSPSKSRSLVTEESMVASTFSPNCTTMQATEDNVGLKEIFHNRKPFDASIKTTDTIVERTNSFSMDWITDKTNDLCGGCSSKTPRQEDGKFTHGTNTALIQLEILNAPPRIENSHLEQLSTKTDFTTNQMLVNTKIEFTTANKDGYSQEEKLPFTAEDIYVGNSMDKNLHETILSMQDNFFSISNESVHCFHNSTCTKTIHGQNTSDTMIRNRTVLQDKEHFHDINSVESNEPMQTDFEEEDNTKSKDVCSNTPSILEDMNSYKGEKGSELPSVSIQEKLLTETPEVAIYLQTTSKSLVNSEITIDPYCVSSTDKIVAITPNSVKIPQNDLTPYMQEGTSTDASFLTSGQSESSKNSISTNYISARPFATSSRLMDKLVESNIKLSTPSNGHKDTIFTQENDFSYSQTTNYEASHSKETTIDTRDAYTRTNKFSHTFLRKPQKATRKNCQVICTKKNVDCSYCKCCSENSVSNKESREEKFITQAEDLSSIASTATPIGMETVSIELYHNLHGKKELIGEKVSNSEIKPQISKFFRTNIDSKSSKSEKINGVIKEMLKHILRIIQKEVGVEKHEPCQVSRLSLDLFRNQGVSPFTLYMMENFLCSAFLGCAPIDGHKLSLITAKSERLLRTLQRPINQLTKIIQELFLSPEIRRLVSYSTAVMQGHYDSIEPDDKALYELLHKKVKGIHFASTNEECEAQDSASGSKVFQNHNLESRENVVTSKNAQQSITKSTHKISSEYNPFVPNQQATDIQDHLAIQSSVRPFFVPTSQADSVRSGKPTIPGTLASESYYKETELTKDHYTAVLEISTILDPPLIHSTSSDKYYFPTATERKHLYSQELSPNSEYKRAKSSEVVIPLSSKSVNEEATFEENLPEPISLTLLSESYMKDVDDKRLKHTNTNKNKLKESDITVLKEDSNTNTNTDAAQSSKTDTNGNIVTKKPPNLSVPSRLKLNNSDDTISVGKDHLQMAIQNRKNYVK